MNKSLIITILLIFTAAVVAVADDMDRYPPPGPYGRIPTITITGTVKTPCPEFSDDSIRRLAASGEICRVLGHIYGEPYCDQVLTSNPPQYLYKQKCRVCGKVQSGKYRSGFDWQD